MLLAGLSLLVPLVRLQLLDASEFAARARDNRLRPVRVPAIRGTIRDREGRILAENVPGHDILLLPASEDSIRKALATLAPILDLDSARIAAVIERRRRRPNRPVSVVRDASFRDLAMVQERRILLPGVLVMDYPKRHYPDSAAVAHLVGYLGEISDTELRRRSQGTRFAGQWVGRTGLEQEYQDTLAGDDGIRYLSTDALGRFRGWVADSVGVTPRPGEDIRTALDLDLQRRVAARFPAGRRGAFVALDPSTGTILALYSHPSFDPNIFVEGMDPEAWEQLRDDPAKPLLDRAIGSVQPPASTWKPLVAGLALDAGVIQPTDTMPVPCRGGMSYGGRFYRCWGIHGRQDLLGALQVSCDVYFYQLGLLLGLDRLLQLGTAAGLGTATGVDVPGEAPGLFPASRDWWRRRLGYRAREGEVLSLAIGQGPQGVTPLKLAQLYAALARPDGTAPIPWLVERPDPPLESRLAFSPATARVIRSGLRRVVAPGGTAARSALPRWDFMGKTGTAQNPRGPDHGWFAGIAGPRGEGAAIVAVAFIEHGEHGSDAARFVAEMIDHFLTRRFGGNEPEPERGP